MKALRAGVRALAVGWAMLGLAALAAAQEDGGVSYDAHGEELLESLEVPLLAGAPFSLMLATEWSRPMANGGTFTIVNQRPMRRDAEGRLYQERWLLMPKGSQGKPVMSWIQIADPKAGTLMECQVRTRVCYLETMRPGSDKPAHPELAVSGPLKSGRGTHTHEDLGAQTFAGVPVHGYRETTTLKAGVMGNSLALVTVRDFKFSPALGIDLSSVVETPRFGRQEFTVTEISTAEPEAKWFQQPAGYRLVDQRKVVPEAK